MAKNTDKQYAKALCRAVANLKGEKLYQVLEHFTGILAREHKLKRADNIINEFIKYYKMEEGIKEINITTARKLDEKMINKIKAVFGKNVEAEIKIDPSILGGIKIATEDKILDASLRTHLNRLRKSLA